MKKERIFYLDFIRAISMFIIVTYHFIVHFASDSLPILKELTYSNMGIIGVAMFFMISGASLMYNYGEKLELKHYYQKRFLGIYPMFWIAYASIFLLMFYECKGFFCSLPLWRLIFSFFALDGYVSAFTETIYIIGEWFLGCIVIIYLIFPLLRILIKKIPKISFVIFALLYIAVIVTGPYKIPLNQNLMVSTFSFLMGMYFIEYYKEIKWWHVFILAFVCVGLFNINTDYELSKVIFIYNLIAYCLYIILAFWGSKIKSVFIKNSVDVISKYSYAIFLVHHFIILKIYDRFSNTILNKYSVICVYLICWILIGIFSKLLYTVNKKILDLRK